MLKTPQQEYKEKLSQYLEVNPSNIFLFWKGRVALYAILKAMGIGEGDEVILPAFTCVVVPNAIMYLGAKPVYVDIDPYTYNIDVTKISPKITAKTKAILAQNTFGLSPDIDALRTIASQHHLSLIEDCAHGFGGHYKGKKNGTLTSASFYSSQWNKPFSTGIGGMAVVQDAALAEKVRVLEANASVPSMMDEWKLKALLSARKYLMKPAVYWKALHTYRWLSMKGLVVGSSSKEELEEIKLPEKFLAGMTKTQARKGIIELRRIDTVNYSRKNIANTYSAVLSRLNIKPVLIPSYAEHTFLKYPLLVTDRAKFMAEAEKEKVEIGDWFNSPLHPVQENLERWHYQYGTNPVAESISRHIVNLPTHQKIPIRELLKIHGFLKKHENLLMP